MSTACLAGGQKGVWAQGLPAALRGTGVAQSQHSGVFGCNEAALYCASQCSSDLACAASEHLKWSRLEGETKFFILIFGSRVAKYCCKGQYGFWDRRLDTWDLGRQKGGFNYSGPWERREVTDDSGQLWFPLDS